MDLCCALSGGLMLASPPFLLCWTAAVLFVRVMRDRPVGLRNAYDAFTTGFQVLMTWLVASALFGGLGGAVTWLPFVIWPDAADRLGVAAVVPISAATLAATAAATWWLAWPIARDEWRRLTDAGTFGGASE